MLINLIYSMHLSMKIQLNSVSNNFVRVNPIIRLYLVSVVKLVGIRIRSNLMIYGIKPVKHAVQIVEMKYLNVLIEFFFNHHYSKLFIWNSKVLNLSKHPIISFHRLIWLFKVISISKIELLHNECHLLLIKFLLYMTYYKYVIFHLRSNLDKSLYAKFSFYSKNKFFLLQ